MAGPGKRPILIRIPWSHYCQKAEWGLSQAGIAYDTWDIGLRAAAELDRLTDDGTVPILLVDGELISGSDQILLWASERQAAGTQSLYPEALRDRVQEWEVWANEAVGPTTRREAYRVVYNEPQALNVVAPIRLVCRLGRKAVLPVLKFYKVRRFDESDAEAIPKIIENIAGELERQGTGYLLGDAPTAADHAVAALCRPLIYAAPARPWRTTPGWDAVVDYVHRVKPARTTRKRRRRMGKRQWRAAEAARSN